MVALLKEAYKINAKEFKNYIKKNSLDLDSIGWDKKTGWGLFKLEEKPNKKKIKPSSQEDPKEKEEGENIKDTKFIDIENHWAKENIKKVSKKGLITGYSDETFRPDEPITRAEIATILVRALNL